MTALSVFERRRVASLPACEHCSRPAWAATPHGLLCQEHTVAAVADDVARSECDWMPRKLKRRRG